MATVLITPRGERSIKKLDTSLAKKVLQEFFVFAEKPKWQQSRKVRKIVGTSFYRYKSGNHRILFEQYNDTFEIFDVRKRDENTYKNI